VLLKTNWLNETQTGECYEIGLSMLNVNFKRVSDFAVQGDTQSKSSAVLIALTFAQGG
jgi:hypothetical protein